MVELSNAELLARLRSGEDHFTERKTFRDRNGWLKTVVAFANSAPLDWPGMLFIGVTNEGAFETDTPDLEKLAMEVTDQLKRAYPPIYHLPKVVIEETGLKCLVVLVPGSPERPHFSGKAYVRVGPRSEEASEQLFAELIVLRNSKARTIREWKDRQVTLEIWPRNSSAKRRRYMTISSCTSFWATVKDVTLGTEESFPLKTIDLSFDHTNGQLMIRHNE
jgi:hypothetical protein